MNNIIIEENKHLERFFSHYKKYSDFIKNEIYTNILTMINEKPHKIKTVRGYKYREKTIYEYKIPLEVNLACRVAYIHEADNIIVFFISTTIIKREFTKLVADLTGVEKY